jgi:hypothetical protein
MGTIPVLLHTIANLSASVATLWPSFFTPFGITLSVAAIVGLFGEYPSFQWIQANYVEAFAMIGFAFLVTLTVYFAKMFIFGVEKVQRAEVKVGRKGKTLKKNVETIISQIERETGMEIDLVEITTYLKWIFSVLKTRYNPISLFKKLTWTTLAWSVVAHLYAALDFFGFHFLTATYDWIFGVVNLGVALVVFIVGCLLTWWVFWMDSKRNNAYFWVFKRRKTPNTDSVRGTNVWIMEVILYIAQIPLFKCSLVFSYWLFYKHLNYNERISLLIGVAFFVVVDLIALVLLKLIKRWANVYSPEEKEEKGVPKTDVELVMTMTSGKANSELEDEFGNLPLLNKE